SKPKRATATFELPGLTSSRNHVTTSGDTGVHAHTQTSVHERRLGKFSRTLQLPLGRGIKILKAKMENGVLTAPFRKVSPE
ncbi:hypothetical protein OG21DRAFT_1383892, partial [Imleria badia]